MLRENDCQLRIIIYDTLLFKNKCQIFFHTKTEILSTSFIKINSKVDALRRKMIPKKGLNTRKNGEQRNWKICRPKNHWTMVTLTCIHPNLPKFNTLIYIYGFLKVHQNKYKGNILKAWIHKDNANKEERWQLWKMESRGISIN